MARLSHARTLAAIRGLFGQKADFRVEGSGRHVGRYYGAYITSAFQPWRDAASRVVAVEAYARLNSKSGRGLSPWQLFVDNAANDELVALDRLCRTVHTLNHFVTAGAPHPLVLNVDARLLSTVGNGHGDFFHRVLDILNVAPARLFIDISTTQQFDLTRLRDILASYRRHGFGVAVNVEGALHARALAHLLLPDILMVDALHLATPEIARHFSALANFGGKLAVKRIETAAQYETACRAGAYWVQGHYFDPADTEAPPRFTDLPPAAEAA